MWILLAAMLVALIGSVLLMAWLERRRVRELCRLSGAELVSRSGYVGRRWKTCGCGERAVVELVLRLDDGLYRPVCFCRGCLAKEAEDPLRRACVAGYVLEDYKEM